MPKPRRTDAPDRVSAVIGCVRADLRRSWTMADMGAIIGVTGVQLRRIFAEGAGASPCRFLIDLRLQAAADLLADPGLRVKDILERVGITDGSHFCRDFRDRFGASPTEFRARPVTGLPPLLHGKEPAPSRVAVSANK